MKVIVTSVGYADFLAVTLTAWQALVPSGLVIATAPSDQATQHLAASAGVPVCVTDAWTQMDPSCHVGERVSFNMALGLDAAFAGAMDGEVCGHVSADCYPVGRWPAEKRIAADAIYGFWRYDCPTPQAFETYRSDRRLDRFPRMKNAHGWPIGYCQLFRYRAGVRFGSFPTAGKFDIRFREQFTHKVMLDDVALIHLGPSSVRSNWAGRTIPAWGSA